MYLNLHHLDSLLLILISISVFMASSRPIVTDSETHVAVAPPARTVVLKSSDGEKFEVRLAVALQSETIRQMIVDGGFSDEVVLFFPNITGETMAKVLEYCNKHEYYDGAGDNITAVDEMAAFDAHFADVHYETLFKLFLASNDLKLKNLYDLVSERIGDMVKGKTPNAIREMFSIKEGLCVDRAKEETFTRDNAWAFD